MSGPILFYFDVVSPYAYLASEEIGRIAAGHGRAVDWRPILLGVSMLKVMGLKAVPDTPLKGAYAAHDWRRFARLLGVPCAPGVKLGPAPLPAMRAFAWAKDRNEALAQGLMHAILRSHWAEGRDMSSPEAVAAEAAALGIDPAELIAAIGSDAVKARLRQHVDAALAAGVFGAPTVIVDGEMFWGADRLAQVERWLETGGW
jgi:2-hydroxychromene-2-carboxylate isomerase